MCEQQVYEKRLCETFYNGRPSDSKIFLNVIPMNQIITRLQEFIEAEARSCSMDPGCITAEYVFRMWGGSVPLPEIEKALRAIRERDA